MEAKITVPYWFQNHPKGILYYPVQQDWATSWSLFLTGCLWDVHPLPRQWFKGFGFEGFLEFCDVSIKVSKEVRRRHSVDSRRFTPFILQGFMGGAS